MESLGTTDSLCVVNGDGDRVRLNDLLSKGDFGDSASIIQRANARYAEGLRYIDRELRMGSRISGLLESCSGVERTYLLRSCILRAHVDRMALALSNSPQSGSLESESALADYARLEQVLDRFVAKSHAGPLHEVERCESEPVVPVIDNYPFFTSASTGGCLADPRILDQSILPTLYKEQIRSAGEEPTVVRAFSKTQLTQLEEAIELLMLLSPQAGVDIAINVEHICLIDYARWANMADCEYRVIAQSMSRHPMPSCVFLSCHALSSTVNLAEAIFHETLHRKLNNIACGGSVFAKNYRSDHEERFHSDWNTATAWNTNLWSFDRALDAYHVYVHLFGLWGAWVEVFGGERQRILAKRDVAWQRATKLRSWLRLFERDFAGSAGERLLDRLDNFLDS